MFKRVLILFVLFIFISCKQNPSSMLSYPPTADNGDNIDDGNIDDGNIDDGNINNGINSGSGYGYYDVSILINDTIITNKYRISDTYDMLIYYYNMIIDSETKEPKFELRNVNESLTAENNIYYTFDTNLNIMKTEEKQENGTNIITKTISKKFRGVCLVRIYPDPVENPVNSSLLGGYTLAGIYTEVPTSTLMGFMAMTNSDNFQSYGYDELIVLRHDLNIKDTTSFASYNNEVSGANYTNYRADILFNVDKSINLYYYNPNREFENQNTNYIFKRIVKTAS
ncbi:hypothetical protein [Brachyspira sp. SAP_772]|uniref:hypothetical protein n=1 Tax=Brachyspira sp. SAP_772 TaxID=2608385 RepID=UPI0012F4C822|nr:hypothetical protein [Brachyspira sp. SAP_772]